MPLYLCYHSFFIGYFLLTSFSASHCWRRATPTAAPLAERLRCWLCVRPTDGATSRRVTPDAAMREIRTGIWCVLILIVRARVRACVPVCVRAGVCHTNPVIATSVNRRESSWKIAPKFYTTATPAYTDNLHDLKFGHSQTHSISTPEGAITGWLRM